MPERSETEGSTTAGPLHDEPKPEFRTVNEIVAYNLARARRAKGWTQAEAAERLQRQSGKTWTSATLGASERTASGNPGSRTRQFDANELLAFSLVFKQPIAYFFLPPDLAGKDVVVFTHHRLEDPATPPFGVSEFDLLESAMPLRFSAEVIDGVNRVMRKRNQAWSPGTPDIDWYRPEEWAEDPRPAGGEVDEAADQRERRIFEHQQDVARRAEARLSAEEFGSLLRVHSMEVAKLVAEEMARRGALLTKREAPRSQDTDSNQPEGDWSQDPPF